MKCVTAPWAHLLYRRVEILSWPLLSILFSATVAVWHFSIFTNLLDFFCSQGAAAAAAGFLPEQFFKLFTRRLAALTVCLGSISRGDILPVLPSSRPPPQPSNNLSLQQAASLKTWTHVQERNVLLFIILSLLVFLLKNINLSYFIIQFLSFWIKWWKATKYITTSFFVLFNFCFVIHSLQCNIKPHDQLVQDDVIASSWLSDILILEVLDCVTTYDTCSTSHEKASFPTIGCVVARWQRASNPLSP